MHEYLLPTISAEVFAVPLLIYPREGETSPVGSLRLPCSRRQPRPHAIPDINGEFDKYIDCRLEKMFAKFNSIANPDECGMMKTKISSVQGDGTCGTHVEGEKS